MELGVTRDSPDANVEKAFKKAVRRAHPDKGGSVEQTRASRRYSLADLLCAIGSQLAPRNRKAANMR